MIRRLVLIYPASRRFSGFLSTHRLPMLATAHAGLPILAEVMERHGVTTTVYDEQITPFCEEMVDGADLVGLSLQTSWAPQGYRIARAVRRLGIPVVLGGVHATLNPDEAIQEADFVVRGEGEHTLPELVSALDRGAGLDDVRGLSHWKDGEIRHNPPRPVLTTQELDEVPWPRLDRIEGFADPSRHPLNRLIYFTMATRGCDQACRYCSITRLFGRALRHRSVGSIIEELGSRFDPGRQVLFFMDDSLAVDTAFLKELLEALLREGLRPKHGWHAQMRADVARDPELLRLMKATNCLFVTCGFESIDERSLKRLGKGQSPRDVERAIARLREHDVVVNGFFMFGTDDDGPEAMAQTVRFARKSGCMLAGFMPVTPFPGTATYEDLDRQGRIFTRDWELYDVQHVVFHPKKMTAFDLYWRTLASYPAFYGVVQPFRHLPEILAKRPSAAIMAVGASWALAKHLYFSREVLANLDYLRALRRMRREGDPFPDLDARGLWAKDLVSGRAVRALRRRVVYRAPAPSRRAHDAASRPVSPA
ncbi:MAG: B12-binding domain-containing radical SAM protein [Deltaproteobacteria bacterium]|nr:B12-binding domain-containing radical SAM protein [Deltaproteobacteria bacterium]